MASLPTSLVTDAQLTSAPDDVIRATLIALCHNDYDLHKRVTDVFNFAAAAVQNLKKRKAGDDAADDQELPEARRQKLEGLRVCVICTDKRPYLESENKGEVCWHHPGEVSVNEDSKAWYQWEKNGGGDMDTVDNRETMPGGFTYDCCSKDLTSEGCAWGRHYPNLEEHYYNMDVNQWDGSSSKEDSEEDLGLVSL